jgi:predicted DNA-binding transcriptional regulator AlpA
MDESNAFLTGRKVQARYGISGMTRWRWERNPSLAFPQPIIINGRKLWKLIDLEAWERSRAVASAEPATDRNPSRASGPSAMKASGTSSPRLPDHRSTREA